MYIDMLTWDTTDMDQVTKWLVETNYHEVWIGLRRDPEQPLVWRWINVKTGEGLTGEDVSESENWVTNPQPNVSCAAYNSLKKKWYSTVCTEQLKFVCYDDNLELVTENKTWDDAINHCRKMSSSKSKCDLLSTTTSSQFSYVRDRIYNATSEEVWTGLRFLGGEWWWSDGETLDHQGMLPDCPSQWEHCGTMSKYNTANWITRDCSERRNFICYCTEVAED
ncbi:hypothetical protein ATANTOWER_015578 [Ataeniobius toweri]|uniref:C-type lectin domain-containing protein n=1 Tax=Ataeniobius toweri TaxID=208326 RepID=A0ABU7APC2_9TELE|nr:hypothetical protein [Ataeniobius toweri]